MATASSSFGSTGGGGGGGLVKNLGAGLDSKLRSRAFAIAAPSLALNRRFDRMSIFTQFRVAAMKAARAGTFPGSKSCAAKSKLSDWSLSCQNCSCVAKPPNPCCPPGTGSSSPRRRRRGGAGGTLLPKPLNKASKASFSCRTRLRSRSSTAGRPKGSPSGSLLGAVSGGGGPFWNNFKRLEADVGV